VAKIVWDEIGKRIFETGIDRGVLYPPPKISVVQPGVPWNGLVAVNHAPVGGEAKPYYIDGYKYQNRSAPEEYASSLQAFTSPDEFDDLNGLAYLGGGLSMGGQRRRAFGLTYRTVVGNDVNGVNHGYKIHLVYNALATPSNQNYGTVGDNPEPVTFDWNITTKPIKVAGYKAPSYLVVDSTKVSAPLLETFENLIYGTAGTDPVLPTPAELISLFVGWPTLYVINNGNGTFTISGPDDVIRMINAHTFQLIADTAENNGDGTFDVTSF
jgi:hypothetical protein